jgi:hypothetical protein
MVQISLFCAFLDKKKHFISFFSEVFEKQADTVVDMFARVKKAPFE